MTRSCACYATDPTYLLPTFVSAVQARGAISPAKADVIIICLGADGATEPIFMRNSRVESTIQPIIYHFMSNPKPWHGAFRPWTPDFHRPYVEIIRKYPEIAPYLQTLPNLRRLKYILQQHYKNQTERLTWGFGARRQRILHYESNVPFLSRERELATGQAGILR